MSSSLSTFIPQVCGIGYPLVDVISTLDPSNASTFLLNHKLIAGETILATSSSTYINLFTQLLQSQKTIAIAGGSSLNTLRILQWLITTTHKKATAFIGSIGNDEFATILKSAMIKDEVEPLLETSQEMIQTGSSAVLVSPDGERTLVTYLGASKNLSQKYINSDIIWNKLASPKCKWIFSCGFMCQSSAIDHYKIALDVAKLCYTTKTRKKDNEEQEFKGFAINIGAPYICTEYTKELLSLLLLSDIIFCNKSEALALSTACKWVTCYTVQDISQKIATLGQDDTLSDTIKRRIVIITQGKDPTICSTFDDEIGIKTYVFPINLQDTIPIEQIVDLAGAGDAFAAGFMAYVLLNMSNNITSMTINEDHIKFAIQTGQWAASRIVKSRGATWEEKEELCPYLYTIKT